MRNNKNKAFSYALFLILNLLFYNPCELSAQKVTSEPGSKVYDVVVYGATPSGISSAVNAAREGAKVVIIEEGIMVGGLFSGGLPKSDFKSYESVQGTFGEFMKRVENYYIQKYGKESEHVKLSMRGAQFEPKVARLVFEQMLNEQKGIRILLKHSLESVAVKASKNIGTSISSIKIKNLTDSKITEISGKIYIDATYEGDLMANAGVPYRVGRESRSEYGELYAGHIYVSKHWHTGGRILPGSTGIGDDGVQSYNFRFVVSEDPKNSKPLPKPEAYRREDFFPLLELLKSGKFKSLTGRGETTPGIIWVGSNLPNNKRDVNDNFYSPFTLSLPGEVDQWPEGGPEVRKRIFDRHKYHTLGMLYFLQNDKEVPDNIQKEAKSYGLPLDEWKETDNFTPFLYVREGRRMVGEYVFTEKDALNAPNSIRAPLQKTSIAVGDYALDCHAVKKPDQYYPEIPEGAFDLPTVPYQIPFGVILPKKVDNLLVPVAVSASHVGFSTLRMEPTWAALGQASGLAAVQAIKTNKSVQQIDVSQLQKRLHELGAITTYFSDVLPGSPYFKAAQYFGNQGYFHKVKKIENVVFAWPASSHGLGSPAYPNHQANLDKIIDEDTADNWLSMLNHEEQKQKAKTDALLKPNGKITRGDFLLSLFKYTSATSQ